MFFLSYSKKDVDRVKTLYQQLTAEGFSIWWDEESLLPGQNWEYEIENAIEWQRKTWFRSPPSNSNSFYILCLFMITWFEKKSKMQNGFLLSQ